MKYRKVSTAIWIDERFHAFTDDGKLAFLALLTHPAMTAVGAMRASVPGLAAELGWTAKRLDRALAPALAHGMVEINRAVSYVCLPNFLKHNRPENPNVAQGWAAALELVPECSQKAVLVERCRTVLATLSERFTEAFAKGLAEPSRKPEPEQEPDTGTGAGRSPLPPLTDAGASKNGRPSKRHVDAAWGRS